MRRRLASLTTPLGAALLAAGTAGATTFELSTQGGNTINGGPGFTGGDVVRYDDVTGTQTEIFDEFAHWPPPGEEVDAFESLANGNMLLSLIGSADLGGLIGFVNGDIVEYDPVNDVATLVFEEQPSFNGQADVDAVAILPNGNLLISTVDDETLSVSGLSISDGDVFEWDPLTDTLVGVYFDETHPAWGGLDVDIDAFDVTADGIAFSTDAAVASFPGLPSGFSNSDLVLYDVNTNTAIIWLSGAVFGNPVNQLDAVAVPEPTTAALFALGLVGLALAGRRRAR